MGVTFAREFAGEVREFSSRNNHKQRHDPATETDLIQIQTTSRSSLIRASSRDCGQVGVVRSDSGRSVLNFFQCSSAFSIEPKLLNELPAP